MIACTQQEVNVPEQFPSQVTLFKSLASSNLRPTNIDMTGRMNILHSLQQSGQKECQLLSASVGHTHTHTHTYTHIFCLFIIYLSNQQGFISGSILVYLSLVSLAMHLSSTVSHVLFLSSLSRLTIVSSKIVA